MEIPTSDANKINLKEIVIALNNVLTEIYGTETRLSYLLVNTRSRSYIDKIHTSTSDWGNRYE